MPRRVTAGDPGASEMEVRYGGSDGPPVHYVQSFEMTADRSLLPQEYFSLSGAHPPSRNPVVRRIRLEGMLVSGIGQRLPTVGEDLWIDLGPAELRVQYRVRVMTSAVDHRTDGLGTWRAECEVIVEEGFDTNAEQEARMPAVRGCGSRIRGGLYWELNSPDSLREYQRLIESLRPDAEPPLMEQGARPVYAMRVFRYVLDPPVSINVEAIGLARVGVKVIERNGVWHVLDWIGAEHYPNVADFIEEARAIGISRRIPANFPFERLTSDSRLLCVHAKAVIHVGRNRYRQGGGPWPCRFGHTEHQSATGLTGIIPMCGEMWWNDLDPNTVAVQDRDQATVRRLPATWYTGFVRPESESIVHAPGIFMSVPLSRVAVVSPSRTAEGAWDNILRLRERAPNLRFDHVMA